MLHFANCCTQVETIYARKVSKLLDILLRCDDSRLSDFCDVLRAVRQPHVVQLFKRNGLTYEFNTVHHMYIVYSTILR